MICNIYGGGGAADPPRISRVQNHRLYQQYHTSHKVGRTIYIYIYHPSFSRFSRLYDELCRQNFDIPGIKPSLFVDGLVVCPWYRRVSSHFQLYYIRVIKLTSIIGKRRNNLNLNDSEVDDDELDDFVCENGIA